MRITLSLISSVLMFTSCNKEISVVPNPSLETEVHKQINEYRINKGLDTLALNTVILDFARQHSKNMAGEKIEIGHDGFNQRADAIMNKLGAGAVAENVAWGYVTAQSVVAGWIESDGHRENIEGNYNETAIGIYANDKNENYFTHIFYKKH